jgi:hypothetical protein
VKVALSMLAGMDGLQGKDQLVVREGRLGRPNPPDERVSGRQLTKRGGIWQSARSRMSNPRAQPSSLCRSSQISKPTVRERHEQQLTDIAVVSRIAIDLLGLAKSEVIQNYRAWRRKATTLSPPPQCSGLS